MSNESDFQWDVFLSYANANKDVVRDIANRMKSDGVNVWFDDWEIKPGDPIMKKIEDGLEHSRVLVLCLSAEALAADWPQLESHTFRFKDPLNHNRRFIPLRLDDTPTKGSLAQFSYIDWRVEQRETAYPKLLEACQASLSTKDGVKDSAAKDLPRGSLQLDIAARSPVATFAFVPAEQRLFTGHSNGEFGLWDLETGRCLSILEGHKGTVHAVEYIPEQELAITASGDMTLRVWNIDAAKCLHVLEPQQHVLNVCLDESRCYALSCQNPLIQLWDVRSWKSLKKFEGHESCVIGLVWRRDRQRAISAGQDTSSLGSRNSKVPASVHGAHRYCQNGCLGR